MLHHPPHRKLTRAELTHDQKTAQLLDKLARHRQKGRAIENGQKIILGGLLLNAARTEPRIRKWLIDEAAKSVTRTADVSRLEPLLVELRAMPASTASTAD